MAQKGQDEAPTAPLPWLSSAESFLDEIREAQKRYDLPVNLQCLWTGLRARVPDLSQTRLKELAHPLLRERSRLMRRIRKSTAL